MTAKPLQAYSITLADTPGVVAANTYMSFFNPSGSGMVAIALLASVQCFAVTTAQAPFSMRASRISATSGGTLIPATDLNKFDETYYENPRFEVRIDNPSITLKHPYPLGVWPPAISTGTGSVASSTEAISGAAFLMYQNEGFAFHTLGGDTDQVWSLQFVWGEIS